MATINLVPQVFSTPVVNGLATLNQSATGLSTNDSAQANADMPTAIGIQGEVAGSGVITVAGAGSVLGRVTGSQSTIAGSINSDSAANASIGQAIGIYQRGGESIAVGATGSILGTVDLNQQARSTSVAASANADAITAAVFGIAINADSGSISTGGSGSVQGLALINTSAVATTVGNNAALDGSTAVQQLSTAAGLDLTASSAPATPTVVIGGLGEVVGAVAASGSATASSTAAGNSSATAGTLVAGAVGTLSGIRTTLSNPAVQVAGVASISGSVNADFKAIASSVLGTAQANVDGSAMAVGDSTNTVGGQISIGDDGVFSASADLTSIAQAGSTNGDATASIAPNGQSVVGTALDGVGTIGLSIGGNGRLSSTATARQIGSSATTNGSATTSFGGVVQSSIQGISSSDIAVGGSITGLDATASLIANGSATAVLGAAAVDATNGYRTVGFDQAALSVAGASSGGIRASGDAAVQLIAQSTNGDATTFLQSGDARGLSILGNPGGILIGRDADRLDADARQTIRMAASSVNGNLAQALLRDTITFGAEDGPPPPFGGGGGGISVGASAVVDITSTNLVDLSANNVGSSSSNGEAKATLSGGTFASEAARQIGISIADQGLIQATATSAGRLTAQSVNGNASAIVSPGASFTTVGIVAGDGSGISAGADGDIRAAARMHGTGGSNTPYLLQATSAAGNADALFDSTIGIISTVAVTTFKEGTTINTGTATGNLSADATSSVGLYATSTSGNAKASFAEIAAGNSQVSAIIDSDVRAGSSGRNRVDANAALDLLLNAKTVNGAATATGNSAVYGITDGFAPSTGGNSIQLAGDISAQARFSNTALARSVQGTATSTATNANVLGVNGYDLTVIGSGGLTGSAHGLMRADAGSVDGNAQAKALL